MAESYKRLGAIAPSDDKEYLLYTSPAATQALVSNITVTNRSASDTTFDINVYQSSPNIVPNILQSGLVVSGYSSTDGITWTQQTVLSTFGISKIKQGNNILISESYVNNFGFIVLSKVLDSKGNVSEVWGPGSIAFGAGKLVATNGFYQSPYRSQPYAYSTNGITWTEVNYGTFNNQSFSNIIFGDRFVSSNSNAKNILDISTDGITWTPSTLVVQTHTFAPSYYLMANALGYGSGTYVVAGFYTNVVQSSTDLITWTQSSLPQSDKWFDVAYGNGVFVMAGDTYMVISTDGITWTQSSLSTPNRNVQFNQANNTFISVTNTNYSISTDGITWTQGTLSPNGISNISYIDTFSIDYFSPSINNLYKNSFISANETRILEPGIALGPDEAVVIKDSSGGNLTFSTYGVELS